MFARTVLCRRFSSHAVTIQAKKLKPNDEGVWRKNVVQ